jgi:hypothetical protein
MKKILIGLVAAIAIAAGGFFGFQFYTQQRIAGEVDAAFEQIRASGGKASHGKVSFDLVSRTATIADIAGESATQPPVSVKIASIVASGVSQPDAMTFSADSIEASDMEIGASIAGPVPGQLSYKMPRIVMKDYSGPAGLQRPASASIIDVYRSALEQFATVSASEVSVPNIAASINFGAVMSGHFTYSGTALRDIKGGKIATTEVERIAFTMNSQQAGKPDKMTGEFTNLVSHDFDAAAAAAILDPKNANDDQYHRFYGKTTGGAYTVTSTLGLRMRMDGMTVDDVGLRPSRLQLPALLAMIQAAGATPPTPTQARELMEKVATLYEGIRIGTAEMRGFTVETPQGPFKLAGMKFNLENGKIGEFAVEGLDTRSPAGPVKVGRFALKSLDLSGFLRVAALFSNPAQRPAPDQLLGLFPLIAGVEVKGFVAPFKNTNKLVTLDTFDLNWGQFVGPVPSQARLTAKMTTPVDPNDPTARPLIAAGINSLTVDTDLGAAWTESSRTFVLEPVAIEIGGLVKASARVAFANVPRQIFSFNPQQATAMAAQVEVGTIELTVRDTGGLDLAVAQYARAQNVSREAARQAIIQNLRASGANAAASNPDAPAIADTLARFIETPRTTLTLKLTPRGKVPAMQLLQALQTDPLGALAQFQAEASTAL